MIEEVLNLLQNQLDKNLINRNIQNFDEYNYILFVNSILNLISTVTPGAKVTVDNSVHEFTKSYITIRCCIDINSQNVCLAIYIEIKNNIIINAESSILL